MTFEQVIVSMLPLLTLVWFWILGTKQLVIRLHWHIYWY